MQYIPVEDRRAEGKGHQGKGDPGLLQAEDANHHDLVHDHARENPAEHQGKELAARLVLGHVHVQRQVLVDEPAKRKVHHDEGQDDGRDGGVGEPNGPDLCVGDCVRSCK